MKKITITLCFGLLLFISSGRVLASEEIIDFKSKIHVLENARVEIEETIVYSFEGSRHGIYRQIPIIYRNRDNRKYAIRLRVQWVRDENNNNYRYSVSREGDSINIKIGDADIFVDGIKTYIISYETSGVISYFSDHDEFYWNITGNNWKVPINQASALITADFKDGGGIEAVTSSVCYSGKFAESGQNCSISNNGGVLVNSTKSLNIGEGLTFVLSVPKGKVDILEAKAIADYSGIITVLLAVYFIVGNLVLPLILLYRWYNNGRDPAVGRIVRVFDPPKDKNNRILTPIELGALVDEVINPRDISAQIIDLAIKKYLVITEQPKRLAGLIKGSITFLQGEKIAEINSLPSHQQLLLKAIGLDKRKAINLSHLGVSFFLELQQLKDRVYNDMVLGGFFPESPLSVRKRYNISAFVSLLFLNVPLGAMLFVMARIMSKRTFFGAQSKRYGMGLREFLSSQERQLAFAEKNQILFEKLLPYSIVFGVAKIWAGKFEGLSDYKPQWYQSDSGDILNPLIFTSHLESSLGRVQSAYTPTSITSSIGFSSGFSGGGFGGGGGGSW